MKNEAMESSSGMPFLTRNPVSMDFTPKFNLFLKVPQANPLISQSIYRKKNAMSRIKFLSSPLFFVRIKALP